MSAISRFSGTNLSVAYAKFRPVYPKDVLDIISHYMRCEGNPKFDTALDVACGSGQSTFLLSGAFQRVIGVDVSETQIEQAKSKTESSGCSNVQFILGDAHSLPIEPSSVDLLTCGTAWHWLDPEKFYTEAKKVLKPGGCIAVYCHGINVEDNSRVKRAFKIFFGELREYGCFSEQNVHVVNHYEAVQLPFNKVERVEFSLPQEVTLEHLLGFFSSVSMYKTYCEKYPDNTLLQRIRADYEADSERCDVEKFTFPGFVIMGLAD